MQAPQGRAASPARLQQWRDQERQRAAVMIAAALKQDERLLQDMASKADAHVAQEVLRNARTFHIAWIEVECER